MLGKCALSKGRRQSGLSGELSTSANARSRFIWLTSIIVAILLTEIAPRFTPEGLERWHYALHRLYYLPIISAGLTFG